MEYLSYLGSSLCSSVSWCSGGSSGEWVEWTSADEDLFCQVPDWNFDCGFVDYRGPNEGTPKNVRPHVEQMEQGWILSAGTERSFYDLLFAPEGRCEGLLIRDINPKVKGYCDFLVLLIILCQSSEEFCVLSKKTLEELKEQLLPKIQNSGISSKAKSYFIEEFDNLARCYLGCSHICGVGDNSEVNYWEDDFLFHKLQDYARRGKIIATVGDINDLRFASGRKITLIDASNISDYRYLRFFGNVDVTPRVIHTNQNQRRTSYYSGLYQKPSSSLIERMDRHICRLEDPSSQGVINVITLYRMIQQRKEDILNNLPKSCYTEENCDDLEAALEVPYIRSCCVIPRGEV